MLFENQSTSETKIEDAGADARALLPYFTVIVFTVDFVNRPVGMSKNYFWAYERFPGLRKKSLKKNLLRIR